MSERSRIWLAVAAAMTVPGLAAWFYFVLLKGEPFAVILYGAAKVFILIWPAAAVVLLEKQHFSLRRVDFSKHVMAIPLGLLSGLLIAVVILGGFKFTVLGDIAAQSSAAIRTKAQDMKIINHFFGFALLICLGHSLLEEYYWRWYVFGRLRKLVRPGAAYIAASLAFAAHHYAVLGSFFSVGFAAILGTCVALGGGLWCWLYQKQHSIAGCWFSHMIVDGAIYYIGYQVIFG
ncbi:CPBP family intramembrane glutamic endopeptidase [Planctomycetota bacterium]